MKRSLKWICAALAGLFVASQQANALEVLTLDYRDSEIRSGDVVQLKHDLIRAFPHLPIQRMSLNSVSIEVKGYSGYGDAYVRIGRSTTQARAIYGRPNEWHNPSGYTYEHVNFYFLNEYDRSAQWQIAFRNDRFKLRRVTVELERASYPTPNPPQPYPPAPPNPPWPPYPPGPIPPSPGFPAPPHP